MISPSAQYMFCHSGMSGDEFCRNLVRAIPTYLNEGGFCHLVCNWPHVEGKNWKDFAGTWFQDLGCDVLVYGGGTQSAKEYAMTWLRETEPLDDDTVADRFAGWMDYLGGRQIETISYGVVSMRRTSSKSNWIHLEDSPDGFQGPCGPEIHARFSSLGLRQPGHPPPRTVERSLPQSRESAHSADLPARERRDDRRVDHVGVAVGLARVSPLRLPRLPNLSC